MVTLVRTTKRPVPPAFDAFELAAQYHRILHYPGLRNHVIQQRTEQEIVLFINTLCDMGCAPFDNASVDRYKDWVQLRTSIKKTPFSWLLAAWSIGSALLAFWIIPMAVIAIITGIWAIALIQGAPFEWVTAPLQHYPRPIPKTILDMAVTIKKEYDTDVYFMVDELRQREHCLDPFLIVNYRQQNFYIAVWDEPTFKS